MQINTGIKNILLACFFFSIINALVKLLSDIPSTQIVFFRSLISFLMSGYFILKLKIPVLNPHTPMLFLRGLSGAIALLFYFYTIHHMPLGAAISILYLSPIFTVVFAIFIVKEWPQKKQIPFMLLCFIGVAFLKNFDLRISPFDLAIGVFGSALAGIAYNIIRKLKGKVHYQLIIFYFPLVTIPITLIFLPSVWVTPNTKELILLIAIGVLTQIAQIFMTKAYQAEPASKISHYNYLTCIAAYLTGMIFFNEFLNWYSVFGLFLIFIGIRYTAKFSK